MEKGCKNCMWYFEHHIIDMETKEVETKMACNVSGKLMDNDKPCKLHRGYD